MVIEPWGSKMKAAGGEAKAGGKLVGSKPPT
jgi:hypothetical protein